MSVEWALYREIRRMHLQEHLSARKIASRLGIDRKTVMKYCKGNTMPGARAAPSRSAPVRAAVEEWILEKLRENKDLPPKQRYSAHDIWLYLVRDRGLAPAESTVRRIVRELRDAHGEEFVPLRYEPGEAMMVDWGDNYAIIGGEKMSVSTFCAALPASGAVCGFAYPDKSTLSFVHGHISAYELLGGVARTAIYDNVRTATSSGHGKHAVKRAEHMRLEAHYGFESVFCNLAAGWEKSNVENAVAIIRSLAFVPIPRVKDYRELQAHITNQVLDYNMNHKIAGRANSIAHDLELEKARLMPLPMARIDPGVSTVAKVYPDQTVIYEGVRYSVPHGHVGHEVTLAVTPFEIEILRKGKLLWRHARSRHPGDDQYVFEHYLTALSRKPRAIDRALPIKGGVMPPQCREFLRLCDAKDAKRQLVDIMLLCPDYGRERLLIALDDANRTFNPSLSLVKYFLESGAHSLGTGGGFAIDHKDLSRYDKLLNGGEANEP